MPMCLQCIRQSVLNWIYPLAIALNSQTPIDWNYLSSSAPVSTYAHMRTSESVIADAGAIVEPTVDALADQAETVSLRAIDNS